MVDTSSRCQAYFGRAQTIEAINPSHRVASRGAQLTMFNALATSTSNLCTLPFIATIPSGSRVIIANHPDSTFTLTVDNNSLEGFPQSFSVTAGQLAEIYLVGPATVGSGVPHFGPGLPASWTGEGFWVWDLSSFTRFDVLG